MAIWYRVGPISVFNVASRVGVGLPASRMDVKLVQFLVTKGTALFRDWGRMSKSYAPKQDGVFGTRTLEAVHAFQRASKFVLADGIVSPMRDNAALWDSRHAWTIYVLQVGYTASDLHIPKDGGIPTFLTAEGVKRIPYDRDADPELRSHLAGVLASARAA